MATLPSEAWFVIGAVIAVTILQSAKSLASYLEHSVQVLRLRHAAHIERYRQNVRIANRLGLDPSAVAMDGSLVIRACDLPEVGPADEM